jgi:hypothetical protein
MSLAGEYLYFLFVALLYGSPLIVGALWFGRGRWRLAKTLTALAVGLSVAPLVLMLVVRSGVAIQAAAEDGEASSIAEYVGDPRRTSVVRGRYLGKFRSGETHYRRYQFPSLDGADDYALEILVPPEGAGVLGSIRLTDDITLGGDAARLLLWPARIGTNPSVAPDEFFRSHFPTEKPDAFGVHTVVVGLRQRQSVIVHPGEANGKWKWTQSTLDLSKP